MATPTEAVRCNLRTVDWPQRPWLVKITYCGKVISQRHNFLSRYTQLPKSLATVVTTNTPHKNAPRVLSTWCVHISGFRYVPLRFVANKRFSVYCVLYGDFVAVNAFQTLPSSARGICNGKLAGLKYSREMAGHLIQKHFRYGLGPSCEPLQGASAWSSGFGIFFIFPGPFFRPSPRPPFQNHHRGALSAHGNFAC